jgi:hypothetical protein
MRGKNHVVSVAEPMFLLPLTKGEKVADRPDEGVYSLLLSFGNP